MNTKSVIKNYLSNNVETTISLIALSILSIILRLASPICIKLITDAAVSTLSNKTQTIILLTSIMGVATVLSFVIDALRQSKVIKYGNGITAELRNRGYQAIMKSELYEINKIDEDTICDTLVDSTHLIGDEYFANKVFKLAYLGSYIISLLIMLFVFNSLFGFITLICLPLLFGVVKYYNKVVEKRISIFSKSKFEHEELLKDQYKQLKTIKTRNGLNKEISNYEGVLKVNKRNYAKEVYSKYFDKELISTIFTGASWFAIMLIACVNIFNNDFNIAKDLGSMVACIISSSKIYNSFKEVSNLYLRPSFVDEEYKKLDDILSLKVESRSENIPSLEEIHSLKFNSVYFDYASYGINNKVGLSNIGFEVKKGEKLGIIGLPLSGKTTIADLITKVVRPRQGNVLINNCDINKLNTYYLRDIVTYCPQHYELMDESIENNIIYPLPLDEYKYNDALNKCKLKDLIFSLPLRDATKAREAGLSAADIQKVSLANALYKDSPIIVLDDATSKLDIASERDIMNEFFKLKNKITLVITNRMSIISKCDKVLIINSGKITEYGKVEELMQNDKSTFTKMFNDTQMGRRVV